MRKEQGFTLIEMLVTVSIVSILLGFGVPEILEGKRVAKAALCGANMRTIETAKARWKAEYPGGRNPTKAELTKYFGGQPFPPDPWNKGFRNGDGGFLIINDTDEVNLTTTIAHEYNNIPEFEPHGNCSATNGYNDIFQPTN
jgi:prepilin-type N-terminal cleavage/methylation domain-containing protein